MEGNRAYDTFHEPVNRETNSEKNPQFLLKGSIGFDKNGEKILVSTKGKAFATDETILEVWRELERLSLRPISFKGNIDALLKQLKVSREKEATIKSIISKLASHELISF